MPRLATAGIAATFALALAGPAGAATPSGSVTFADHGSDPIHWTAPDGVGFVTITARGSAGGWDDHTAPSGRGAIVTATFPVTPGQVLEVYASHDAHGYGRGGSHGTVVGSASAHSGAGGGGSSAVVTGSPPRPLLIAGGGGGGGGAGTSSGDSAKGGRGGDAGIPDPWPGAPGLDDANHPNGHGLAGGCGGCEHHMDGGPGDSVEDIPWPAGGGGGGGAGLHGGAGGQDGWTGDPDQDEPIGGSGGGGGSSMVAAGAVDVTFSLANTCAHRSAPGCSGLVTISWGGVPARLLVFSGNRQRVPATGDFGPVSAQVVDADGIPLPGVPVTFTAPADGPSGTFPGGRRSMTAVTGLDGVATAAGLRADATSGTWVLTATAAGIPVPTDFELENAPIATTTTIASSRDPSTPGSPPSFTATVSAAQSQDALPPTGFVSFVIDGTPIAPAAALDPATGTAVLPASAVPALGAGDHPVVARYLGDDAHAASQASLTQVVDPEPTALTLAVDPNPSQAGEEVALTATVTPGATGTVTFHVDGAELGSAPLGADGRAAIAVDDLPEGQHAITADYPGDAIHAPATGTATATVGPDRTATLLATAANPVPYGDAPMIVATTTTVDGPVAGGTVTFTIDGDTACADVPVGAGGTAACPLPAAPGAGTHDVLATYLPPAGSPDLPGAGSLVLVVVPAPSTTAVAVTPVPSVFGQTLLAQATVTTGGTAPPAAGTVQFAVDGAAVGSPVAVSGGTAALALACDAPPPAGLDCPLRPGPHVVEAVFTPATGDVTSSRGVTTARVEPVATSTVVTPSADPIPAGDPLVLDAHVTAPAAAGVVAGAVQFLVDGVAAGDAVAVRAGTARSEPVTTLAPGPHAVDARFLGAGPFASSDASTTVTVTGPVVPSGGGGGGGGPSAAPGAPSAPSGAAAAGETAGRLILRTGRVRPRGTIPLTVTCEGGGHCRQTLVLRLDEALRDHRGRRIPAGAVLARRTISLAAGATGRREAEVTRAAARLLRAHASIPARWEPPGERLALTGHRAPAVTPRAARAGGDGRAMRVRLACERPAEERARCRARVRAPGAEARTVRLRRGEARTVALRLRGAAPRRVRVTARTTIPAGRPRVVARVLAVRR